MFISKPSLFLLGVAAGVGGAYLLQDERARAQLQKLIRSGVKLYDSAVGSYETVKEDVQDMVAEARSKPVTEEAGES